MDAKSSYQNAAVDYKLYVLVFSCYMGLFNSVMQTYAYVDKIVIIIVSIIKTGYQKNIKVISFQKRPIGIYQDIHKYNFIFSLWCKDSLYTSLTVYNVTISLTAV